MTAHVRQAEPELRTYITEISSPRPDDGIQRLHSPMPDPEPLPEPEPALEAG